MNTTPDQPANDDVEGHMPRIRVMDTEAVTEEDVEGHRTYNSDTNIKSDQTQVEFDEDDVEGHRVYSSSDTNVKSDQTQVDFDEDDDAGGHIVKPGR